MITKDLDEFCVRLTEKLKGVLKIMNTQAIRTVLVTDLERRLKGIITDGDVRRGLFESLGLDSEVRLVMTSNPITAKEGASGFELTDVMEKKGFCQYLSYIMNVKSSDWRLYEVSSKSLNLIILFF